MSDVKIIKKQEKGKTSLLKEILDAADKSENIEKNIKIANVGRIDVKIRFRTLSSGKRRKVN